MKFDGFGNLARNGTEDFVLPSKSALVLSSGGSKLSKLSMNESMPFPIDKIWSRNKESVYRFQGLSQKLGFNEEIFGPAVALNTNDIPWHQGPHCMNCYLGQKHECLDPKYAKELNDIKRRVFFLINGNGSFELGKKREYGSACVTYLVKYPPNMPEMPYHDHAHGEEYFIMTGSFDCTTLKEGTYDKSVQRFDAPAFHYVKYPKDTAHAATPGKDGTVILTWWGQNDNDDEGTPLPWWTKEMSPTTRQAVDCNFRDPTKDPTSPWLELGSGWGIGFELVLFRGRRTGETTRLIRLNAGKSMPLPEGVGGLEVYCVEGTGELYDGCGGDFSVSPGWWYRQPPLKRRKRRAAKGLIVRAKSEAMFLIKSDHLSALARRKVD